MQERCAGCKWYDKAIHPCIQYEGDDNPDILIIGMCPGAEEDYMGRPFVGRSGAVLRSSLSLVKSTWGITNLVKCRTTKENNNGTLCNSDPDTATIKQCLPYLFDEIKKLRPKVIITLGGLATKWVVDGGKGRAKPIDSMRGVPVKIGETYVLATYHPAYALYQNIDLGPLYREDFLLADKIVSGEYKETNVQYREITTLAELGEFMTRLSNVRQDQILSIDFETNQNMDDPRLSSLFKKDVKLLCCGFYWGDISYVVHMGHDESKLKGVDEETWKKLYSMVLEKRVISHNFQYELLCLKRFFGLGHGYQPAGDPMLFSYLLDENRMGGHSLENLSAMFLPHLGDFKRETDSTIAGMKKEDRNFGNLPLDMVARRCAHDVVATYELYEKFRPRLDEEGVYEVWDKIMLPAQDFLTNITCNGFPVDKNEVEKLGRDARKKLKMYNRAFKNSPEVKKAEELINNGNSRAVCFLRRLLGKGGGWQEFNPRSVNHKKILFIEIMNLQPLKLSPKTGQPSVDKEFIKFYENSNDLLKLIQLINKENYKVSNFVNKYPFYACEDGRIHGTYMLHGTRTGRLASSQPINMQNISQDKSIRAIFRVPDGYKLLEVDASQMELRVAACLANDRKMIQAYINDEDLHEQTRRLLNLGEDERRLAKVVNFGIWYGMGSVGLAASLGWDVNNESILKRTQEIIDRQIAQYPDSEIYREQVRQDARRLECSISAFGRVRRVPLINSFDMKEQMKAERQVVNFQVQSAASDIILTWGFQVKKRLPEKVEIVNEIHDSLIFLVPDDEKTIQNVISICQEEIAGIHKYIPPIFSRVPFAVDAKIGLSWGDCTKID